MPLPACWPPSTVEKDLGLTRGIVQKWIERDAILELATNSATPATNATQGVAEYRARADLDAERSERVKEDFSNLLHAKMVALAKQADHYGSTEWLAAQPPERVLESTRTLWRNVLAAVDRMAGRPEAEGQTEAPQSE